MNEEQFPFYVPKHYWLDDIMDRGPLFLSIILLYILTALTVAILIHRRLPLPWLLFASLLPTVIAIFASQLGTLHFMIGFMSPPGFERGKQIFLIDMLFFWLGCLTSLATAALSYWRSRPQKGPAVQVLSDP